MNVLYPYRNFALFGLIVALVMSVTFDVHGQIGRRWRTVQPTNTQVCGPDGCYSIPSTTVYQNRMLVPSVQRTYIPSVQGPVTSAVTYLDPVVYTSPPVSPVTTPDVLAPQVRGRFDPVLQPEVISPSSDNNSDSFRRTVIKGAITAYKRGEISRIQLASIRVAMISPAFQTRAKELAITHITSSEADDQGLIPYDENGEVIIERINWDGLMAFFEKWGPLILQLIAIFGGL
jgi:hypothetical protein